MLVAVYGGRRSPSLLSVALVYARATPSLSPPCSSLSPPSRRTERGRGFPPLPLAVFLLILPIAKKTTAPARLRFGCRSFRSSVSVRFVVDALRSERRSLRSARGSLRWATQSPNRRKIILQKKKSVKCSLRPTASALDTFLLLQSVPMSD